MIWSILSIIKSHIDFVALLKVYSLGLYKKSTNDGGHVVLSPSTSAPSRIDYTRISFWIFALKSTYA